jgi:hypothetical protein
MGLNVLEELATSIFRADDSKDGDSCIDIQMIIQEFA